MKPGPKLALKNLPEFVCIDSPPRKAVELLADMAVSFGWCNSMGEARELAEKWEPGFLRLLRDDLSAIHEQGRFTEYNINSSSENMVQGSAFIEPRDDDDIKTLKRGRALYQEYVTALEKLSPTEFEALCAGILAVLGVANPRMTPQTGDEGIDFWGRMNLGYDTILSSKSKVLAKNLSVWMVGQAKHYKRTKVSTFEIRDLVGAVRLAQAHAYSSTPDKYPGLQLKPCDPIFYLVFTTGQISASSWKLLQRSGVVGMDGSMVAAFLAENSVGHKSGRFDPETFTMWIQSFLISSHVG